MEDKKDKKQRSILIGRLYGAAKKNGLDNDLLHQFVLSWTSKESIKQLSDKQISFLIHKLNGSDNSYENNVFKKFNKEEYFFHLQEVIREKYKVDDIGTYLNQICMKQFKVSFSDIDEKQKSRLIGLLKMVASDGN
jgi:hypothetical protein